MNSPLMIGFLALTILTCGSAFFMLWTKNVLHAALAMFMTMLGLAGFYVLAYADVMAVSHLMIYVGGILVVMVFGIMLSQKASLSNVVLQKKSISLHQYLALLACVALFIILMYFFYLYGPNTPIHYVGSDIEIIGIALLTKYLLPFELLSLLLLAAFIFTAMVTRKNKN